MQNNPLVTFFFKPIQVIVLTLFIGNVHSQSPTPDDRRISPKIITQAFLDSTRTLTKGDKKLNATYLSLVYNFWDIDSVEWVYTEAKVPKGEAPLKSYYCAIQGYVYYCGLQTNSEKERRIIFSVWDAKEGSSKKSEVVDKDRAILISAGEGVVFNRFGREGSGVHTHRQFNWQEDSTYKFLIHTAPDSISRTTTITLFVEIENIWKLIAKIKRPEYIGYEKGAAAFLEDFSSRDDRHRRSVSFQNFWVRKVSGDWKEITKAHYYLPFGDSNRKIKDYGCGISTSHGFMLSSGGGFTDTYLPPAIWVTRNASKIIPVSIMPE
jgi:Domain of unknown function (DUF3472)